MRKIGIAISVVLLLLLTLTRDAKAKGPLGPMLPVGYLVFNAIVADSGKTDLKFPIKDREGDFVTDDDGNPFNLDDPDVIDKNVEYDPTTNQYILTETIDGRNIRPPVYMTFEEYLDYQRQESIKEYWRERAEAITLVENKSAIPKLYIPTKKEQGKLADLSVEIRPQGSIDMTFGVNFQKIDNPTLTEQQRKQGGFDFDMNINMSVVGNIGDMIKINLDYNTLATFDFENQIKLKYEGKEDDIIKEIEAGNVSLPLTTSLITGTQSLFGVRTKLQFGRLTATMVYSQQKSQTGNITIEEGAQVQEFEVFVDEYDDNRHFFLAQLFRDNYDPALSNLPNIISLYEITNIEVWKTNRNSRATQNIRNVVAFMDLGENQRISAQGIINPIPGKIQPSNESNDLYRNLSSNPDNRNSDEIVNYLQNTLGLEGGQDFEKASAVKLSPSEFIFNARLGYISLNQRLNPNEVLGVAFEYVYNGVVYRVGDLSQNVTPTDSTDSKVLFVKLLKGTVVRPTLPMWDLMMKNIYSIGGFQINREDFELNILYQQPGGGQVRYIPKGNLKGKPLIQVLGLDKLNNQNDPQPDGVFDYMEGITIRTGNGRIIFTSVEPFGNTLRQDLIDAGDADIVDEFVYDQLYDSIKIVAQQFPELNRFVLDGQYKSNTSSEISLGAFNVPEGSVIVTAGGNQLTEGIDYDVNYTLGRVTILNQSVLNSGTPINVSFENNALFGFQTKTLFGIRLDYRISDKFYIGHTYMRLKERPFTQKVNIGDDPIRNSMWGFDFKYSTESQFLTWLVDKLPFYDTKEKSSFTLTGEMARINPGHNKAIGDQGVVYVDDFEGTSSTYDLRFPALSWRLASTPRKAIDENNRILFPEADLVNNLEFAYNRAKLAWYNIDPLFLRNNSATPSNIKDNDAEQKNHYTREILQTEVFPNFQNQTTLQNTITTFDLAYYPEERGQYNYEKDANGSTNSEGVNTDGTLKDPASRWGGVTRFIDNSNFEEANIEVLEFWVMDPFIYDVNATGGDFYINLGNVSEDVMRDSKFFFENGLPGPNSSVATDNSAWGIVPITFPIVNAFDNDPDVRKLQDIGLDGLNDENEANHFEEFLTDIGPNLDPDALQAITDDPSTDNFIYYRGDYYDDINAGILERYKAFNNTQGNSPVSSGGSTFSSAQTNLPDTEDLNRDNTIDENENYFQYRLRLTPDMQVGENYITDKLVTKAQNQNENDPDVVWYQFKIPIDEYNRKVGNIIDFKSIRYIRMFLTGFEDPVVMRFARLDLVRNQWRRYKESLISPGEFIPTDQFDETVFNVTTVNIEENSEKEPFPYVLPPGIDREQSFNNVQNNNALLNEQSLSIQVCDLKDGDSRAVFKTINLDFRTYERMKMFVHGEEPLNAPSTLKDGDLTVFIRLGRDFTENYYEYEFPLKVSPLSAEGTTDATIIWPTENEINILLDSLVEAKKLRFKTDANRFTPFTIFDAKGNKMTLLGSPDIGLVKSMMIGVRNPKNTGDGTDDGLPKCVELWFDELRLVGLDEGGGWAALGRMETQLADLGNIVLSARTHTIGFGQIEQKVQERFRDNFWQYDAAATIQLGKFFPKKVGLQLPLYGSISQSFSTPQYDPYDLDIKTKDKLNLFTGDERTAYRKQVQDLVTIKSVNLSNVRITGLSPKKPRFYDPANINMTWAWTKTTKSTPLIESDLITKNRVVFAYNYSPQTKYWTPFSKMIKTRSKWVSLVKDFNFNIMPSNLSFNTEFDRQFGELQLRAIGAEDFPIAATFNKYFTWKRFYGFKYNPFRSLSFDFTAVNDARIDEPPGRIDTEEKKDSIWTNLKKFGRTTQYTHSASLNYNVPINKIPLLNWTQLRAGYTTTYTWRAGERVRDPITTNVIDNPFGNRIINSQNIKLNGELNFKNLYDKARFLKPYNSSRSKNLTKDQRIQKLQSNEKRRVKIDKDITKLQKEIDKLKKDIKEFKAGDEPNKQQEIKNLKAQRRRNRQRIKKLKRDKNRIQSHENPYVSPIIRPLISVKRITVNYTENRSTDLPGWLPKTRFLGQDKGFNAPGVGFIIGLQPDITQLDEFADKGYMTADTNFNYQFMQTVSKNLNIKAVVEPFKNLRVDLTVTKQEGEQFTEFFKKLHPTDTDWVHAIPITTGNYTVSFISVKTLFNKSDDNGLSPLFKKFEDYRTIIAQRLANGNPNSNGEFENPFYDSSVDPISDSLISGFYEGYGPNSRDVLIPAFIAAYQGKDPNTINMNPFKTIPLPNWRITYNGLHKFKALAKVFRSVNITHGYNSTYTVGSFQSEIFFEGDGYFKPSNVDTGSNNFYSLYRIPYIVITEQFSPLIGIDITWKNGITTRFNYKKSRNLSMSFVDFRLSETRITDVTVGFGYRLKGLKLPFKFKGKKVKLKNDINFIVDVSFQDRVTTNYELDRDIFEPTSGNKILRISPRIDYIVNDRLNISLFFERTKNIPATSAAFPITNTKAGIKISFSLTQ